MASLFDARHDVTEAEMSLARRAWDAYCSPAPDGIESLLGEDARAMPYLRGALLQHLARFPSVRNGLGLAENKLLELIADGHSDFMRLCPAFFDARPDYGLGDFQVWRDIERMAEADQPLITLSGLDDSDTPGPWSRLHNASFEVTKTGMEVLNGRADFIALAPIDQWLGGVHLCDREDIWRWDEQKHELIHFN
jgi:hypothetical protein